MAWLCPRAASGPWASAFFSSRRGPNTCLEETKWGEVLAQESAESCRGCTSWSPLSQATSERGRKEALKAADDRGRGGLGQPGGSGPRSWSLGVQSSRQGELGASGGGAGSAIAFTASPGKRPRALTGWSSGHGAHLLDSPAPPAGDLPSGSPGHPALDLGLDTRGGWHSAPSPGPPLRVGPCCKRTWAWCGLLGASRQHSALRSPRRPPLPPESLPALTSVSQEGGPGPARTAHTAKSVH